MQQCTKCKEFKELEDFVRRPESKTGYRSYCKICNNKKVVDRANKDRKTYNIKKRKNAQKIKNNFEKAQKEYYEKHPERLLGVTCLRCKIFKPLNAFVTRKDHASGIRRRCKDCHNKKQKAERLKNPEIHRAKVRASYYKKHEYYKELHREYGKKYPEKAKERTIKWQKNNPAKVNAGVAYRRSKKFQRTPKWLSKLQIEQINQYYHMAKFVSAILDEKIHVDHIVPLNGENVSGLHVPWNLQLLRATENCKKSNKF